MAPGIYRSEPSWPASALEGTDTGVAGALAAIGQGLSNLGRALEQRGGSPGGGPTAQLRGRSAGGAGIAQTTAWPRFDALDDEAAITDQIRTAAGRHLQELRALIEQIIDREQGRPNPRPGLLRTAERWLSNLDDIDPEMWQRG